MDHVITFHSTHHAIKAEKRLKTGNFKIELIPTPREISSECGFTILMRNNESQSLAIFLEEDNLLFDQIYKINENHGEKRYEEID